jgi:hypothetical protein
MTPGPQKLGTETQFLGPEAIAPQGAFALGPKMGGATLPILGSSAGPYSTHRTPFFNPLDIVGSFPKRGRALNEA